MRLVTALLALSLVPAASFAWDKPEKHHKEHGWEEDRGRGHRDREYFREDDIRVIREYYRPRSLPPGLEKKLYRTGQLPPGWEKKIRPFPVEVERRLAPAPDGCVRGYVDGYAIVYQPRTRAILDIHAVIGL